MLELLDALRQLSDNRSAVDSALTSAIFAIAKDHGIGATELDGKANELAQYGGAVIYYP
jgi:hypothetical protein